MECHNISNRVKEVLKNGRESEIKNILHYSKEYSLFHKNIFFFPTENPTG